jgi:uncharacterized membrane protein YphA (DoxX/SURF4 family)
MVSSEPGPDRPPAFDEAAGPGAPPKTVGARISDWLRRPLAVVRLEIVRIVAPVAILGFMSDRLAHADEWLGNQAFRPPPYYGDWRVTLHIPAVPPNVAWAIAAAMVLSGLATSLGLKTRWSGLLFTATLIFVALSDHLTSFTVTKIGPVVMLTVVSGPAGSRLGLDAWRRRQQGWKRPKKTRPLEGVRFLQLFLAVVYCASGIAKARGDWLTYPLVLWTQLHDSYETAVTFALASVLPAWVWTFLQGLVLTFEVFAPLWFALPRTRPFALLIALGMHVMIGLMFGPVVWFALLMITLLVAAYMPDSLLTPVEALATRLERLPGRFNRGTTGR